MSGELGSRAIERTYTASRCIAGVDEAGRGPLAGPVVAAACVWPLDEPPLDGIDDSKALTAARRDVLFAAIVANPRVGVGVGVVCHKTIDEINILQATMQAMRTAVEGLPAEFTPDLALIDGNRCPTGLRCEAEALVKGDARCYAIAAASIVAKVTRDRLMQTLHAAHPEYGFDRHMGYPTKDHVAALHRHGPLPEYRRSFNPLRTWIAEGKIEGELPPPEKPKPAPKRRGAPATKAAGQAVQSTSGGADSDQPPAEPKPAARGKKGKRATAVEEPAMGVGEPPAEPTPAARGKKGTNTSGSADSDQTPAEPKPAARGKKGKRATAAEEPATGEGETPAEPTPMAHGKKGTYTSGGADSDHAPAESKPAARVAPKKGKRAAATVELAAGVGEPPAEPTPAARGKKGTHTSGSADAAQTPVELKPAARVVPKKGKRAAAAVEPVAGEEEPVGRRTRRATRASVAGGKGGE